MVCTGYGLIGDATGRLDTSSSGLTKRLPAARSSGGTPPPDPAAAADSSRFNRLASSLDIPFSDREWDVLSALAFLGPPSGRAQAPFYGLRGYMKTGILDRSKNSFKRPEVALRKGTLEEIVPVARLLDENDVHALLERVDGRFGRDNGAVGIAYKIA